MPMLIPLDATCPTVIPSVAATLDMPQTIVTQVQEVLATTTNLGTQTRVDQEVSVPETHSMSNNHQ